MDRSKLSTILVATGLLLGFMVWIALRKPGPTVAEPQVAITNPTAPLSQSPPDPPPPPPAAATASITGRVHSPRGDPIPSATVCAWTGSNGPHCTTTAVDGGYRLDNLPPARVTVHAHAPEFLPGQWFLQHSTYREPRIQLLANHTHKPIDIELRPGGVALYGQVRDIGGGAIEGATISSTSDTFGHSPRSFARSGPDGHFTIWTAPGLVELVAYADAYATATRPAAAPGSFAVIRMTPESVIQGQVISASSGEPVEGVTVTASARASNHTNSGRSGVDGRFEIAKLEPGIYELEGRGEQYYARAGELVHLGLAEAVDGVVITAHAAALVRGQVVVDGDDDGEARPCRRGFVRLIERADYRNLVAGKVGEDGHVQLRGVLPGVYEVTVACEGMTSPSDVADVVVQDAQPTPNELVWAVPAGEVEPPADATVAEASPEPSDPSDPVVAEGVLTGRVVDSDGAPVVDAFVTHQPTARGSSSLRWRSNESYVLTDLDGRFRLDELVEGVPHTVGAFRRGGGSVVLDGVYAGQDVALSLVETGEIAGTVMTADGSAPQRYTVTATAARGHEAVTVDLFRNGGRFRLHELPAGSYALIVESPAGVARVDGIELAASEVIDDLVLTLTPRVTVRGRILDEGTRAPVPGVTVSIWPSGALIRFGPERASEKDQISDEHGRFEVDGAPTGRARISLEPSDETSPYEWEWLDVEIPVGDAVVELGDLELAGAP